MQSQHDPLIETLNERHELVTQLTKKYYQGDVIPPSTKSQILRAQKFSVFYYYCINAVFFLYCFFIPLWLPDPYYGGMDVRDFQASQASILLMVVLLLLPLIRFVILSWTAEFYHYGCVLVTFELLILIFVGYFWSPGMPVVLVLFISNLLNLVVTQLYWKDYFTRIVRDLEILVPPSAGQLIDNTELSLRPGLNDLYMDFRRLWGFTKYRTSADLYDERCGVFSGKEQISHVKAMFCTYMQAIDPTGRWVLWRHLPYDLWHGHLWGLLDGLLNTFVSNAAYAFSGLWLGKVLFINWFHGGYALVLGCSMICIYCVSYYRTTHWLEEGLGVAVAEKEWLAFDVVRHQGAREAMSFDVLDLAASGDQSATQSYDLAAAARQSVGLNTIMRGRLNLTFMWICVASVADFIGESYLAKLYWNLASETRFMVEALTPYDFKLYQHARWEVMMKGIFIKIVQNFILILTSCLYFGGYYFDTPLPIPLMFIIGASCFLHSILKVTEAMQFAFTILGEGKNTHRHAFVAESIVLVMFIFVLINILIWLYLLPIEKRWDLPVGKCNLDLNVWLFPSACHAYD